MRSRFTTIIFAATLLLALALPALATVPTTLSYQGTLTDKAGTGITGSRALVFSLYNVATGGTPLWSETQTLTVASGRFGAILGVVSSLDVSMLGGDTWLGIGVQGEPEMTPRQKLTSVAYAMKAAVAESVANTDSLIPAGTVVAYGGTTEPAGWLFCDGRSFAKTAYPRLSSAIGIAHGGDADNFNLPDYRGRFLRGVDGTGVNQRDPDQGARTAMNTGGNINNTVGSVQGDDFKLHSHYYVQSDNPGFGDSSGMGGHDTAYGAYTGSTGGNETRPKNAYVNWIIKY